MGDQARTLCCRRFFTFASHFSLFLPPFHHISLLTYIPLLHNSLETVGESHRPFAVPLFDYESTLCFDQLYCSKPPHRPAKQTLIASLTPLQSPFPCSLTLSNFDYHNLFKLGMQNYNSSIQIFTPPLNCNYEPSYAFPILA